LSEQLQSARLGNQSAVACEMALASNPKLRPFNQCTGFEYPGHQRCNRNLFFLPINQVDQQQVQGENAASDIAEINRFVTEVEAHTGWTTHGSFLPVIWVIIVPINHFEQMLHRHL